MNNRLIIGIAGALVLVTGTVSAAQMSEMEFGIGRVGGDYRSFIAVRDDPQLCLDQCAAEAVCQAWSYDATGPRTCYLKAAAPDSTINPGYISGVKTIQ